MKNDIKDAFSTVFLGAAGAVAAVAFLTAPGGRRIAGLVRTGLSCPWRPPWALWGPSCGPERRTGIFPDRRGGPPWTAWGRSTA